MFLEFPFLNEHVGHNLHACQAPVRALPPCSFDYCIGASVRCAVDLLIHLPIADFPADTKLHALPAC